MQVGDHSTVSIDIALYLGLPEGGSSLGRPVLTAFRVTVPKAAVDEYHNLPAGQNDIGAPRKQFVLWSVYRKSEAHAVKN